MKRIGLKIFIICTLFALSFVSWISLTTSGLQWLYQISSAYIPAQISLQKIEGRLSGPLSISGLSYQQADGSHYQIAQLDMQWRLLSLLSGTVDIQSLHAKTVLVTQAESSDESSTFTLPELQLPLQVQVDHLLLEDLTVNQAQQSFYFKRLQLSAATLFDQLTLQQLSVETDDYRIAMSGGLRLAGNYRHRLKLDWSYQLANNRMLRGNGELMGDIKASQLTQTVAGALSLELKAQLKNLLQNLTWQADLNVKQFDSKSIVADWPALSGQMIVNGSGTISQVDLKGSLAGLTPELGAFDSLFDISASTSTPVLIRRISLAPVASATRVEGKGEWTPGQQGGEVDLKLNWQHLKWPLTGDSWFDSPVGQGTLRGSLSNYQFSVQSERPWTQLPLSNWTVSGQGNLEGLTISDLNIKTLQGEVNANGKVDWKQSVSWQAAIQLQDINPAGQWPQWPGRLSASLNTDGSYRDEQLIMNGDIQNLSGVLRDYALAMSGKLQWSHKQINLQQMALISGQSQITVDGQYGDTLDLQWSIDSKNLAELYPETSGRVKAHGQISGTQQQPRVTSDFNADHLAWRDIKVGSARGRATVDISQWYQAAMQLDAKNIEASGVKLQSAVITSTEQGITAKLVSDWASTELKLTGSMQQDRWQGVLTQADITTQHLADWKLMTPAHLTLGRQSIEVEKLCFINTKKTTACASLMQSGEEYQSEINIEQLTLAVLKPWLAEDVRAVGMLNAHAQLVLNAQRNIYGQIDLSLPEGVIHYLLTNGERQNWSYRDGQLKMQLNAQGIQLKSSLQLNQNDSLNIDMRLPKASLLSLTSDQLLEGEASLDIRDVHLLESLIPEVQNAKGEVKLQLKSAGTLKNPGLKGQVKLDNGSFNIPRLGLNISGLKITGESSNPDQMQLNLQAHSGAGDIAVTALAKLNSMSDWSTELQITGKNFLVSKIPEANVQVSPDLKISIKPQLINIEGNLHVPFARLNPKDVSSAVQVSEDVVIVGSEQDERQKWIITSKVRLTLDAEHVRFFGYGFEGNIAGSLLLEDRPGQLTRATGEIKVPEGRYRAYGQRLAIENGRLIFSGGPITNPGLDLKARRVINEVTAGVNVSGTLLKPQLDLYSIPAMGQTDALAYLILGRPMESNSNQDGEVVAKAALALGLSGGDKIARMLQDQFGLDEMRVESSEGGDQASLVVGRYLSSRLYVSYGVGLIESINTFSMRYQLSDKWQLKAESGESQSADLFYTIER